MGVVLSKEMLVIMNSQRRVRLGVVTGLPGSGKSWLIENHLLPSGNTSCNFDDFHANSKGNSNEIQKARRYEDLLNKLGSPQTEFCVPLLPKPQISVWSRDPGFAFIGPQALRLRPFAASIRR